MRACRTKGELRGRDRNRLCIQHTIIAEAMGRNAELIVIGKAGIHPYADLFTGTTAERVVRFSDRPVLTVKQAANGPYRRILSAFDGSEGAVRALKMALVLAPDAEVRVSLGHWRGICSSRRPATY